MFPTSRPLEIQRQEFKQARLIAMPIAGLIIVLERRWRAVRATAAATSYSNRAAAVAGS